MSILKKLSGMLVILTCLTSVSSCTQSDDTTTMSTTVDLHHWMRAVADDTPLGALSIPGTHDSGARIRQEFNFSRCQEWDFKQQLERGIRFFDIRINGNLEINHAGWYQHENLGQVISIFEQFLRKNPSEAVIMSIKQEDSNSPDFASVVEKVIQQNPQLWHLDSRIPMMHQARGKIILFRRYPGSMLGIPMADWPDNTTFTSGQVSVQDRYHLGSLSAEQISEKWQTARELIEQAKHSKDNRLYVNFLSASGGLVTPRQYAWGRKLLWIERSGVLQHFTSYLNASTSGSGSYGIIVMDYPSIAIIEKLVTTNFSRPPIPAGSIADGLRSSPTTAP